MGCNKRTADFARCTIPNTPWVYGYGQYRKKIKDVRIYKKTTKGYVPAKGVWDKYTPGALASRVYDAAKKAVGKTGSKIKEAVVQTALAQVIKNQEILSYYIYIERPGLYIPGSGSGSGKLVLEWFHDKGARDKAFLPLENVLKNNSDKKRVTYIKQLFSRVPKPTNYEELGKLAGEGLLHTKKKDLETEVKKNLPQIPPPESVAVEQTSPWVYVGGGVALFGFLYLLFSKKQ